MSSARGHVYLYLLVFSAGFATLGVELAASRLLDPWFGNSLIVWASLIGLIMLYLAIGYTVGGRLADRSPKLSTLLRITGLAGLGVSLIPTIARPVLMIASRGVGDLDAALLIGSMMGILVIFAAPITLLGCVSPFAVRLALADVAGSGQVAGRIYTVSTVGSLLGSFLPVLILVPNLGARRTFGLLALALLTVTLVGLLRQRRWPDAVWVFLSAVLALWLGWRPSGPIKPAAGLLFETESAYNYIQVIDAGSEYQLRLNEGEGIHSVYRKEGGVAYGIWDYFLLAPAFNPAPYRPVSVRHVAIIGLAGGTMARLFTDAYGPIAIEGAELDPAIIAVGRTWFAMTMPNLTAVATDGRRFLQQQGQAYDLIAVDAYRPPYIPFHLTSVEFFTLANERLAEDGVVAVNVGRTHTDYSLVDAIVATMAQVFPSVYILDEPDEGGPLGNTLVIATRRPTSLADFRANLSEFNHPLLAEVATSAAQQAHTASVRSTAPIFTDDRAPVEQVVHALVLRHLLGLASAPAAP